VTQQGFVLKVTCFLLAFAFQCLNTWQVGLRIILETSKL
jgi:hypothetical protein